MEDQAPNSEFGEFESQDFLGQEDLEAFKLMASNEWVVTESHGDNHLRNLLATRELLFDKTAAQEDPDIESQGSLRIINELIRARKTELGIDPTLEP